MYFWFLTTFAVNPVLYVEDEKGIVRALDLAPFLNQDRLFDAVDLGIEGKPSLFIGSSYAYKEIVRVGE